MPCGFKAGPTSAMQQSRVMWTGLSGMGCAAVCCRVRDLLALPPPRAVEPFKRAISTRTRETARLLCSGEGRPAAGQLNSRPVFAICYACILPCIFVINAGRS